MEVVPSKLWAALKQLWWREQYSYLSLYVLDSYQYLLLKTVVFFYL